MAFDWRYHYENLELLTLLLSKKTTMHITVPFQVLNSTNPYDSLMIFIALFVSGEHDLSRCPVAFLAILADAALFLARHNDAEVICVNPSIALFN